MSFINPLHIAFVAIVALLVLGPKRFPEVARSVGNGYREFREQLSAVTAQATTELTSAPGTSTVANATVVEQVGPERDAVLASPDAETSVTSAPPAPAATV
jgi:sec-independent protein translocase protein TatA